MSEHLPEPIADDAPLMDVSAPGRVTTLRRDDAAKLPGLSAKRVRLAEVMIYEGLELAAAADRVGLSLRGARYALAHPGFRAFQDSLLRGLRQAERARNFQRAKELREQNENRRVALDAVKFLDTEPEPRPGVTVNVGVGLSMQTAGYLVAVPRPTAEIEAVLREAGSSKSVWDVEQQ